MKAHFVFALGDDVLNTGVSRNIGNNRGGVVQGASRTGDQQIQVAGGFPASTQRTCWRNPVNTRKCKQVSRNEAGGVLSHVDPEAACAAAIVANALAQLFNLLISHAGKTRQAPRIDGLGKLADAGDLRRGPQQRNGLGPHAGQFQQLQNARAVFGQQFLAQRQCASGSYGLEVGGHAFAYSRNLKQAGRLRRGGHEVHCRLLGGLGGTAIAADAKAVSAVDLQQVGCFGQQPRHGGVVHCVSLRRQ